MKVNWQGVFPAVTTQFNQDGSLNLDAQTSMLNALIEDGIHGIIALGTVGENYSLTPEEKREVLAHTMEVVNGRVPVLTGCAEITTKDAKQFAQDAEALGVSGLMLLPGLVYISNRAETLNHYQQVARATKLPIMIYNNPVSYGIDIDLEMTSVLAEESNIVAIKESTTDTRRITELRTRFGDRFIVFCGVDDIALESMFLGATGWISGLTNVFPRESVALYNLAQQGRIKEARELYEWFLPLLRLDTIPTLVQCIKLAEQIVGRGQEYVREPRLPLAGEDRDYVCTLVEQSIESRLDLSKY